MAKAKQQKFVPKVQEVYLRNMHISDLQMISELMEKTGHKTATQAVLTGIRQYFKQAKEIEALNLRLTKLSDVIEKQNADLSAIRDLYKEVLHDSAQLARNKKRLHALLN